MGMIAATDVRGTSFAASFCRIGLRAAWTAIGSQMREGRWRSVRHTISSFISWSVWPIAGLLPRYRKVPAHLKVPRPASAPHCADPGGYERVDRAG
jgi:hypothetical protein